MKRCLYILAVLALAAVLVTPAGADRKAAAERPRPAAPVVVRVHAGGFDWGDAGIGAAAAAGLIMLGLGLFRPLGR